MSTILTHLYIRMGKTIPKNIAKLMMSAIISDTLNLKSPTTTKADKFAICLLASYIELPDVNAYATLMFQAKTDWACSLGAKAMTRADAKEFEASNRHFRIAVLEIAGAPDAVVALKDDIRAELQQILDDSNGHL